MAQMFLSSLGPTTIRLLGVLALAASWLGAGTIMASAQSGSPPEVTVDTGVLNALGPAKQDGNVGLHPPRRHGEAAAPRHRERRATSRRSRHESKRREATRHTHAPKHAAAHDVAARKPPPAETHHETPVAATAPAAPAHGAEAARIERAESARLRQARAEIDAAARKAATGDSLGPIPNPGPGPATPPKPVATSQAPVNAAPDLSGGVSPRTATAPSQSSPLPQQTAAARVPKSDAASPPAPAAVAPAPVGAPDAAAPAPASPPPTRMAAAPAPAIVKMPPPPATPAKPASVEAGGAATAPHIDFLAGSVDLTSAAREQLDTLAKNLSADQNKRLQLVAYATGTADEANQARRLSLSRALNVRAYLIDHGVRNTRMDVRALGNRDDGAAPADRVDIVLIDSK
jgi:outer membrane protein OmpA-like peptidoglycan-associated protein